MLTEHLPADDLVLHWTPEPGHDSHGTVDVSDLLQALGQDVDVGRVHVAAVLAAEFVQAEVGG